MAAVGLATAIALLALAGSAQAASFTVNNTGDATDVAPGDGVCRTAVAGPAICTLRAAIVESEALAGDDDIGFTLPNPSTITLNTALPVIENSGHIVGPGSHALTVRRNPALATPAFRIFTTDADLYIEGMTVTNGRDEGTVEEDFFAGAGGGIANLGALELNDVTVTGNTAILAAAVDESRFAIGGGIANVGLLAISDSTVSNNTASSAINSAGEIALSVGGGIGTVFGNVDIFRTTISGNTASATGAVDGTAIAGGGGIAAVLAFFDFSFLQNSTVSGNKATATGGSDPLEVGGGVGVGGAGVNIGSSTIAFNEASTGANIGAIEAEVGLYNTIVSNPVEGENCAEFGGEGSAILSYDTNLSSDESCPLDEPNDQEGVDPQLAPLADNGGPSFTHAPAITSPAIDQGSNVGPASYDTDQRHNERTVDVDGIPDAVDGTDIGSVELGAYEAEVLGGNPVGYWRFGESFGTFLTDSSGKGNHGVYEGGVVLGVPGALAGDENTAGTWDGVNDIGRVPDSLTLKVGTSFTFEGWIKRATTTKSYQMIMRGNGLQVSVMSAGNGNQVWLRKANTTTIARSTGGVPADGNYHHVVVTQDGLNSAKIYIDGVDQTFILSTTQQVTDTPYPLIFGTGSSGIAQFDEFALYDQVLPACEVGDHYATATSGPYVGC